MGWESDSSKENLFKLSQHNEVTAILCSDPLEQQLPAAGYYAVTDGESIASLQTSAQEMRRAYEETAITRTDKLGDIMSRLGIPLLKASTDESELTLLQSFYGK